MKTTWLRSLMDLPDPEPGNLQHNRKVLAICELEARIHDAHDFVADGYTFVHELRCARSMRRYWTLNKIEWQALLLALDEMMTPDEKILLKDPPV